MAKYSDLVQICLPTYNGESHLAQALDSLLAQTHRNIEIVIMDNASTDGTARIAQEYARKDSRIRYFRSENFVCATDNWNRAFEKLDLHKSEFFMWASDDDLWAENYIESLLEPLKKSPSSVLSYSQFDQIDQCGCVVGRNGYRSVFPIGCKFNRLRSLIVAGQYSAIYGLIRVQAITWKPCMSDVSFGSDLWFMIQLCAAGPFEIVKTPLFLKRLGGISATGMDSSASHDSNLIWNIGNREWRALSDLKLGFLTKAYIYNRLRVSSKILFPEKTINPVLLPWVYSLMFSSNKQAFGFRTRLKKWIQQQT